MVRQRMRAGNEPSTLRIYSASGEVSDLIRGAIDFLTVLGKERHLITNNEVGRQWFRDYMASRDDGSVEALFRKQSGASTSECTNLATSDIIHTLSTGSLYNLFRWRSNLRDGHRLVEAEIPAKVIGLRRLHKRPLNDPFLSEIDGEPVYTADDEVRPTPVRVYHTVMDGYHRLLEGRAERNIQLKEYVDEWWDDVTAVFDFFRYDLSQTGLTIDIDPNEADFAAIRSALPWWLTLSDLGHITLRPSVIETITFADHQLRACNGTTEFHGIRNWPWVYREYYPVSELSLAGTHLMNVLYSFGLGCTLSRSDARSVIIHNRHFLLAMDHMPAIMQAIQRMCADPLVASSENPVSAEALVRRVHTLSVIGDSDISGIGRSNFGDVLFADPAAQEAVAARAINLNYSGLLRDVRKQYLLFNLPWPDAMREGTKMPVSVFDSMSHLDGIPSDPYAYRRTTYVKWLIGRIRQETGWRTLEKFVAESEKTGKTASAKRRMALKTKKLWEPKFDRSMATSQYIEFGITEEGNLTKPDKALNLLAVHNCMSRKGRVWSFWCLNTLNVSPHWLFKDNIAAKSKDGGSVASYLSHTIGSGKIATYEDDDLFLRANPPLIPVSFLSMFRVRHAALDKGRASDEFYEGIDDELRQAIFKTPRMSMALKRAVNFMQTKEEEIDDALSADDCKFSWSEPFVAGAYLISRHGSALPRGLRWSIFLNEVGAVKNDLIIGDTTALQHKATELDIKVTTRRKLYFSI